MIESRPRTAVSEERALLRELNHRINNDFASVISIASFAAARSGSEEAKAALSNVCELLHKLVDVRRALQVPEHDTYINAAA
jgi:two-component sensor histidine kinase